MMHHKDMLMDSISGFFSDRDTCERVRAIVSGEGAVSLRLIEWFVNTYARRHAVGKCSDGCDVYSSYRAQLKTYTKQNFDPFRRHERIAFVCDDIRFETTVGQLNFFRWALQNKVLEYIAANRKNIESEMASPGVAAPEPRAEAPAARVQPSFVANIRREQAVITFD